MKKEHTPRDDHRDRKLFFVGLPVVKGGSLLKSIMAASTIKIRIINEAKKVSVHF